MITIWGYVQAVINQRITKSKAQKRSFWEFYNTVQNSNYVHFQKIIYVNETIFDLALIADCTLRCLPFQHLAMCHECC